MSFPEPGRVLGQVLTKRNAVSGDGIATREAPRGERKELTYCARPQSRTQSPQAFWSAERRQERLWDNGISYPRKRGIPVLVRMLKVTTEVKVKCLKVAAVLLLLGLKVLSGLESVRESQN